MNLVPKKPFDVLWPTTGLVEYSSGDIVQRYFQVLDTSIYVRLCNEERPV